MERDIRVWQKSLILNLQGRTAFLFGFGDNDFAVFGTTDTTLNDLKVDKNYSVAKCPGSIPGATFAEIIENEIAE